MKFEFGISLLAALVASGCAFGPGTDPQDDDVERRISALERELAALKQTEAEKKEAGPGAAPPAVAAGPPAAATPQAAPSAATPTAATASAATPTAATPPQLPTWNVTPDITFKPGARLQVRYLHDGSTKNNEIAVQRFRMKAAGQAWKAKYGLEFKIDNTGRTGGNTNAAVENGWLEYSPLTTLTGRAGLYDVPFSRDALTSDSKLLFMDRSLIKDALTSFGLADNGIGGMAYGRPLDGHLEYAVGVFNNDKYDGLGTSGRRTGSVMPVGRIAVDLLDPSPPGGYADYRASYIGQGKRLSIAADGAWLQNGKQGTQRFDLYAWGTDLFFNYGPFTFQGEYDWFRLTGNVDRSNRGWFVQSGYLIEPLKEALKESAPWFPDVEAVVRYQDLDAESYSPTRERRASFGVNTYIWQHNLKVQTEYSFRFLTQKPDTNLFQTQIQLDF